MSPVLFILNTIGPIFLIIFIGYLLKTWKVIDDRINALATKLVFNLSLPALIFTKLAFADLSNVFDPLLIGVVLGGTLIIFSLSWVISIISIKKGEGRGVFIQGTFRGNLAILGMAMVMNLYGDAGAAKLSAILVFTMPLYNILSIIVLTFSDTDSRKKAMKDSVVSLLKNPLILSIIVSVLVSLFNIPIHSVFKNTSMLLAQIALPLALIGIGATLELNRGFMNSPLVVWSTIIKLLILPILGLSLAFGFGLTGDDFGILFIVFACPTAIASYVMASEMGKHGKIAANIVVLSTLGSLLTISLGVLFLKQFGLI